MQPATLRTLPTLPTLPTKRRQGTPEFGSWLRARPMAMKALHGGGERAAALAAMLSSAWVEFATTGTPSAERLPTWKSCNGTTRSTLVINDESMLVDDPMSERRQAMGPIIGFS